MRILKSRRDRFHGRVRQHYHVGSKIIKNPVRAAAPAWMVNEKYNKIKEDIVEEVKSREDDPFFISARVQELIRERDKAEKYANRSKADLDRLEATPDWKKTVSGKVLRSQWRGNLIKSKKLTEAIEEIEPIRASAVKSYGAKVIEGVSGKVTPKLELLRNLELERKGIEQKRLEEAKELPKHLEKYGQDVSKAEKLIKRQEEYLEKKRRRDIIKEEEEEFKRKDSIKQAKKEKAKESREELLSRIRIARRDLRRTFKHKDIDYDTFKRQDRELRRLVPP